MGQGIGLIDLRVQAPHFSPPLSGDVGEYLGNTKDKIDQIMIMSRVILLISAFALAGCWQSEDRIYMAEDYFIPVKSELVSISDEFGPLGIYEINSENQYRPVFRDAEPNSFEQKFRVFNIGAHLSVVVLCGGINHQAAPQTGFVRHSRCSCQRQITAGTVPRYDDLAIVWRQRIEVINNPS